MTKKSVPNLLLPGFQKCGTASLHFLLGSHPQLFVPTGKPQFFSIGPSGKTDIDKYLSMFDGHRDEPWVVDTSDSYIENHFSFSKMKEVLGDEITFLIIMRDPVKRIYSAYAHIRRPSLIGETREFDQVIYTRSKSLVDLLEHENEQLEKAESEGKLILSHLKKRWADSYLWNFRYIFNSVYSIHIKALQRSFPRSRYKFIIFENFIKNPRDTLAEIYEFLNIEREVAYQQPYMHKNRGIYSTLDLSKRHIKMYLDISRSVRSRYSLKVLNYFFWYIEEKVLARPFASGMPTDIDTFLRKLFAAEIDEVGRLTRLDTSCWK
ncbi:MAG: sulfotransferase domain-containing protein [Candidatus Omnitrophota bacterium]